MRNTGTLILTFLFSGCFSPGTNIKPERKDITQAVYASGKIYPVNKYTVSGKLPGYIQKIHVKVGDTVRAGDPLITILSEVSELNVNSAKNILNLARENAGEKSPVLTALRQDVASAKTKYELDSANYFRYRNLAKENAVSQVVLDQSRTQFEISRQTFVKASNNLESTHDRLKVELQNAENQYQAQLLSKNDFTLFSVIDGKVYDILPDEGALVSPGMPLIEIGDGTHFFVEMSVDEMDIALIQTGQEIVFEIDAFRDKIFKGNVTEVFLRVNPANKTSRVLAGIQAEGPVVFHSGMSVEANIIVSQKKNALVIPREYIKDGNKVKLANGGMKEIKIGVEDLLYVEILDGIIETAELQKP